MTPLLDQILTKIQADNPMHAGKLRRRLERMDPEYFARTNRHLSDYDRAMQGIGQSLDFGVQCYLRMCADMDVERINFLRTGKYANTSYKEVERRVYGNPDVMEYHMHGLALAQFLWLDQYERLRFFMENIRATPNSIRSYLEIGGGHGVYTKEALAILPPDAAITLLDISESSLKLAKLMIASPRPRYILKDIFEWSVEERFDFITIAEVIEHLENPEALMARASQLLAPGGAIFLTTPINAPMIDHIRLFSSATEIRDLLRSCGFSIERDLTVVSDDIPEEKAIRFKIPIMYATLLRKTQSRAS